MITLTKEWLHQTIAELEEERDAVPGAVNEDAAKALAAMKLALASLEAEAMTQVLSSRAGNDTSTIDKALPEGTMLYTAPPAPVSVPDLKEFEAILDWILMLPCPTPKATHFAKRLAVVIDTCRSAMLQNGNSPAQSDCCPEQNCIAPAQEGNYPVITDGWVACSERMPDIGTEIFYFCQDDGLRDCGIVSSSNFSGKGDAELYVHAEGYDLRFGVDISHWMPLPASPQQK